MKALFIVGVLVLQLNPTKSAMAATRWIVNRQGKLPLTAVSFTFQVGSADDPVGNEGLAGLTASLLQDGGVKAWNGMPALQRADIQELLSLSGANFTVSVEKQQTSLRLMAPAAEIDKVVRLAVQMLVAPAFDELQVDRLRNEAREALSKQWPREDQEELGKAVLDYATFGPTHPYSHVEEGKLKSLNKLDRPAVQNFYKQNFTADRITIGMAGRVDAKLRSWVEVALKGLPKSKHKPVLVPEAPLVTGLDLWIVKGDFEGTGIHFGSAIPVTRSHADFPALYLAATAFGKHRSFVGRLMRVVREERGLNYGAYSYAEDFPDGGRNLIAPTHSARSIQSFTIWGRPTPQNNGCFLARQLWREVSALAASGLSENEFTLAQSHLVGSIPSLALSIDRQLGFATDSVFYDVKGDFLKNLVKQVASLDRKKVNEVIARFIKPENFRMVVTTADPEKFKKSLLGEKCAITYGEGIVKSAAILNEDKLISETKLPLKAERIYTLDAGAIF